MSLPILGAWSLDSFEIKKPDQPSKPWGKNLKGLLIYDQSGQMSVSINREIEKPEDDPQSILNSLLFYSGTFEVKDGEITHLVTIASSPNRIGKPMKRFYELKDDLLTLTTPEENYGKATLRWKRIRE